MKYFVRWKEPNTDWEEISRERALEILEPNYKDPEEALRGAENTIEKFNFQRIPCMFCDIEVNHGAVVKSYFAPYHDVTVYEDGWEDWFYIGD